MERDEEGRLRLTEAEAEVVRAALFVALHHQDEVLGHCSGCFQTITGVEEAQVKAVMADLDELNGHNARVAEWIAAELERVARMTDDELSAATFLPDLIRSAEERGLSIPPKLKDRA